VLNRRAERRIDEVNASEGSGADIMELLEPAHAPILNVPGMPIAPVPPIGP